MNEVIASIYGTGGVFEKTAAEGGERPTLSDLALSLVTDGSEEAGDLTKVASDHAAVYENLIALDQTGRAMAQIEFGDMEKRASEGDDADIMAFFGVEAEPSREDLVAAARAELARRAGG